MLRSFDSETAFTLAVLLVPTLVLAYRYRVEWGASFAPGSGLWRGSTIVATLLLLALVVGTGYFGSDDFQRALGIRRSPSPLFFAMPGVGLAIALFPGPAAELTGRYKALVEDGGTRQYAWVGWALFAFWSFMLFLRWFARAYR